MRKISSYTEKAVQETSTIDRYKLELEGSVLEMTPIHKNATFFKQNAQQLVANDAFLLRRLVKICEQAIENEDYQTIKVVLNDYEMFMQNYP